MTISENYAFSGVHHIFDQVINTDKGKIKVEYVALGKYSWKRKDRYTMVLMISGSKKIVCNKH